MFCLNKQLFRTGSSHWTGNIMKSVQSETFIINTLRLFATPFSKIYGLRTYICVWTRGYDFWSICATLIYCYWINHLNVMFIYRYAYFLDICLYNWFKINQTCCKRLLFTFSDCLCLLRYRNVIWLTLLQNLFLSILNWIYIWKADIAINHPHEFQLFHM